MQKEKEEMIKDIYENKVSTQTLILTMNLNLEIEKIFESIDFAREELRVGKVPENGFQLMAFYYKNGSKKHEEFTERKKKKQNCFRNALNIVFEKKETRRRINIKASRTGRLQVTGCQDYRQVIHCILFLIRNIIMTPGLYQWKEEKEKKISIYIQTVMTNIDFNVGFPIDRVLLHELLNKETTYLSLMETSFGYTGINIKIPVEYDFERMMIPLVEIEVEKDYEMTESKVMIPSHLHHICYGHQVIKKKFNTFLVFHSGTIIMSGMMLETMKGHYRQFMSFLSKWSSMIQEKNDFIIKKKSLPSRKGEECPTG
jgi:hypothetical protein